MAQITVELSAAQAAGLKRFCEKSGHLEAMAVLYPHTPKAVRDDQVRDILAALDALQRALDRADVSSFPWLAKGGADDHASKTRD